MRKALRGGLLVLVVATGAGCKPPGFFGVLPPPAIGVMVEGPANLTLGFITHVNVTVARLSGYTGPIDLSMEGLPAGITAAFVPATVPDNSSTSVLTLRASSTASPGTFNPTVRAHAEGVGDATVSLVLVVTQ